MKVFDHMGRYGYEQLLFCHDSDSGLKAIISIHSTVLGPALGGTRMWNYGSEEEAVVDVLRLSRGMTYKAAAAGLPLGGGKAVIIGDPKTDKTEAKLMAYGRFIERLKGLFITAEDVGTCPADMDIINRETGWVQGTSGSGGGDPSPYTALGVLNGIRAALRYKLGDENISGKRIAVQGVGSVGYNLCRLLAEEGAALAITDINAERAQKIAEELDAVFVAPGEIFDQECDVFAPCALGAVINDSTIPRLKCSIIAGSANNVLAEERHGNVLQEKNILYVPDYVVNAGGLICVADELEGFNRERVLERVAGIYETCMEVFKLAEEDSIPTFSAADRLAERMIAAGKKNRSSRRFPGRQERVIL